MGRGCVFGGREGDVSPGRPHGKVAWEKAGRSQSVIGRRQAANQALPALAIRYTSSRLQLRNNLPSPTRLP